MRRPPPLAYLIGNTPIMLTIFGCSAWTLYQWWIGDLVNGWMPLAAMFASGAALNASEQVTAYGNWKRAWDAMGDNAANHRRRRLWQVIRLMVWMLFGLCMLGLDYRNPTNVLLAGSYGLATLVLLVRAWWVARRQRVRVKPAKLFFAAVAVPRPRDSPSVEQIRAALPPYCIALIGRADARRK